MASTKNNFLNAKPVSKLGGKSGGIRKPSKPYSKPPASTKGKPKVKSKPAKPAAKAGDPWKAPATQNSRTSAPKENTTFRTQDTRRLTLPNSQRAGTNLPKDGAAYLRGKTQGPKAPPSKPATTPTAKSSSSKPASTAPKPVAKPTAAKPNPYTSGKPNPNAGVRGVVGAKTKPGAVGRGGRAALTTGLLTAATAKAADVLGKAANPKEWERVSAELKDRGYGSNGKPVKKDANGRSSTGVRVSDKANQRDYKAAPTGSQQYNDYRNQQIAAERERLKGVGNPPKPKPPATRPAGTQPSRTTASRPSTPAAPKKPAAPASPKDRRVSAATANRESGNYGTSRTNNPMIDDAMKARMRQREERDGVGPVKDGARYAADVKSSTQGVGPVKDGERYASNLKPANKNKPAEKGMTLAERMRKRRQGLA